MLDSVMVAERGGTAASGSSTPRAGCGFFFFLRDLAFEVGATPSSGFDLGFIA
jgi:hypothetical protein